MLDFPTYYNFRIARGCVSDIIPKKVDCEHSFESSAGAYYCTVCNDANFCNGATIVARKDSEFINI